MTVEQFLRDKGILSDECKEFMIKFQDGRNVSVKPTISEIKLIQEYADQFKPKWISVDYELPGRGTYLFYDNEDCITIWYNPGISKEKWEKKKSGEYRFTHWMPLPKKPEL